MNFDYIVGNRTAGANPFKIFEAIQAHDPDKLAWAISRMPYPSFLQSAYWFAVSMTAKSRAGMRCQVCNSGDGIQVHHRTYDTHGIEHLNMMDLVVLCQNCHGLFHGHSNVVPTFQPKIGKGYVQRKKLPRGFVVPHSEADIEMPEGDQITLTKGLIDRCRTNGAFTNAALRALGITKEMITAGWPARLIGKVVTRDQYRAALEGRFIYKSGRLNQ